MSVGHLLLRRESELERKGRSERENCRGRGDQRERELQEKKNVWCKPFVCTEDATGFTPVNFFYFFFKITLKCSLLKPDSCLAFGPFLC